MIDLLVFIILVTSAVISSIFSSGDAYLIGRWGGGIFYPFLHKDRGNALKNIKRFTGIEDRRMVLSNFKNIMGNMMLKLHIMLKKEKIKIVGEEYLKSLKLNNKGFFVVSLHYGLWEIIPFVLEDMGVHTVVVFAPFPYKFTERLIMHIRKRSKAKFVPASINIFKLLKFIRKGKALGLMLDQHRSTRLLNIPFLSGRLKIPEAPFYIANKRKISILPVFSYIEDGKAVLRISSPILPGSNVVLKLQSVFQKYLSKKMENFVWTYSGL